MKKWLKLIGLICICEGAGVVGSLFTFSSIPSWYAYLHKPLIAPPNYVFGPVWTTLYALMGIALYFVVTSRKKKKIIKMATYIFGLQLVLNIVWSLLFFGLRSLYISFIEIVFLWITIAWTMYLFFNISKRAGFLLIPYLVWVSFAAFLNLNLAILN